MKPNQKKVNELDRVVEVFTKYASMKFSPQIQPNRKLSAQPQQQSKQQPNLINKVKSYFSPPKLPLPTKSKSPSKSTSLQSSLQIPNPHLQSPSLSKLQKPNQQPQVTIKHLHRLTHDHFLIGNEDQLEAINMNCVVGDYVDPQLMWTFSIGKKIMLVVVDTRRSLFVIVTREKDIICYEYQFKRNSQKPTKLSKLKLDFQTQPKYSQFSRDGQLMLFYQTYFQVYFIEGQIIERKQRQNFPVKKGHNLKLFQVPLGFETKFNAFFQQDLERQDVFGLWCLDVDVFPTGIKIGSMVKVYEIELQFKKQLQISNYSKQVYLLNLGFQIFAIKKGYVIDSANVNIQSQESFLTYLGNQKLLHISDVRVDVYKFSIKESSPPKITITSMDSILLPQISQNFQFYRSMEMLNSNIILFYQLKPQMNQLVNETRYKFCLSKKMPFDEKVDMILPSQNELSTLKSQIVEEKCDIIKKMGLSSREVYLRIWNRSQKEKVSDFKFLLSTDHYETIKEQIEKKLRKQSMSYRQLHTLEKVCCQMLSQKVFGQEFTPVHFKNFLISHFLLKKYELYYEFSKIDKFHKGNRFIKRETENLQNSKKQEENKQQVMINVQDYHKFSKADIKAMLIEYMSEYCVEQKQEYVDKIRVILKHFKFSLRIDYLQIVQEAVKTSHNNFLVLLRNLPELLPFVPEYNDSPMPEDPELFEGVWSPITQENWQKNLHKQRILTIYNKETLEETYQSDVWYRRNWNTLHDCVFLTKKQIVQIHERNSSEEIFYLIISEIYEKIQGEDKIKELLMYIEKSYNQVPVHLKNRIFLYKSLFDYFEGKQFSEALSLREFLKLQDFQLFKLIFKYQKTFKNLIFSQIKPLFRQICLSDETFNQGLLNYFNSELSQISDVKYLLNRMNNKKRQFHIENEQTYEVLVKAIQSKIRIGSSNDIPIDEVLIYIENIPLSSDNEIMEELYVIEQINEEAEKFRKMKLNMSLYEIINNPDSVISSIIEYEIQQSHIFTLPSIAQIKNQTYRIIAQTQAIKEKIYNEEESDLTFFIYLTKILEQEQMIAPAKDLLQDPILHQYYTIDEMMIENLVLFMYKMKFSIDPVYVNNRTYITKLVQLLPQDNQCRQFIFNELQLGVYLSPPTDPLWYPIGGQSNIISVFQLQSYINHLPSSMLPTLDAEYIFNRTKVLQQIASDGETVNIRLNSIYQFIILKLISNFQLRQALAKTKQCFQKCEKSAFDFLYPAMILAKVYHQFCEQNRQAISLCARYLFKQPKKLVELLQDLMLHKYTSNEQKQIIFKVQESVQKTNTVFTPTSILLQKPYMSLLLPPSPYNNRQTQISFNIILIQVQRQLLKLKDEFKTFDFHIIFTLLVNDPYVLVKWVFLKRFQINLKNFRCFLSYLIREDVFDRVCVLEFGKRLFRMLWVSGMEQRPIEQIIDEFRQVDIITTMEIQRIKLVENEIDRKISKSIQRFKTKLKMVKNQSPKIKASSLSQAHEKIKNMVQQIKSPLNQLMQPFKYYFYDSDDDAENKEQQVKRQEVNKGKKEEREKFDPKLQRTLLMSRRFTNGKPVNLYVSSEKTITTNMFFSQNFGIKGNLLNQLVKSKKFPTLKKSKQIGNGRMSMGTVDSNIMKNDSNGNRDYSQSNSPQKNTQSEKKPKKKFNIAKAQSQYVNLDDFMKFEKLVRSIEKQGTSKESEVQSINDVQISRQLKMQEKTISSPQSKPTKDYLQPSKFNRMRKISEEIPDEALDQPTSSNVTKQLQSQQSSISIELMGNEQHNSSGDSQKEDKTKNIVDEVIIGQIVQEVLKMFVDDKNQGKVEVKCDLLQGLKGKEGFVETVKTILEKIYQSDRPTINVLNIIKAMAEKYPESQINKTYLNIYMKTAQLHGKFSLKFPFRKVFVPLGLFLEKGSSFELYSYLSHFLQNHLDDQNIVKISKVLSLAFQRSEIEVDVHFILLKKYIKEVSVLKQKIKSTNYVSLIRRKEDVSLYNFEMDKLESYVKKLPAQVLIEKDQDIFNLLTMENKLLASISSSSSDLKNLKELNIQIIGAMALEGLRNRGQGRVAQMLKKKWERNAW